MKTNRIIGFTLVELLVVIAIIGVLVSLLFPAIKTVIVKGEITEARADIKALEAAIRSYINEYGKVPTTVQGSDSHCGGPGGDNSAVIQALLAQDPSHTLNPRQIVFLQVPSRKSAFVPAIPGSYNFKDPWTRPYMIYLNGSYSGTLTCYSGVQAGPVVIASAGPDGLTNSADDVFNYQ